MSPDEGDSVARQSEEASVSLWLRQCAGDPLSRESAVKPRDVAVVVMKQMDIPAGQMGTRRRVRLARATKSSCLRTFHMAISSFVRVGP